MSPVFIATPVYKGAAFVAETLESIRAQTFTDFRVMMSVDGADGESAQACRPFTSDPRFELVVQPEQLGWAGNLNWLMGRAEGDYFCYWQHDDLADPSYLERLHEALQSRRLAAVAFSDVQWFGAKDELTEQPSLTGFALNRVLIQIERMYWAPFRGLVRMSAVRAAGPLRITEFGSNQEDVVWLAKLAREGEFIRVPQALYRKRAHAENVHASWFTWTPDERRGAWMEVGLGFLEAILPLLTRDDDRERAVRVILNRLVEKRPDRWMYVVFSSERGQRKFAREFRAKAHERFGLKVQA